MSRPAGIAVRVRVRVALALGLVVTLAACTPGPRIAGRTASEAEMRQLAVALGPLLAALRYPPVRGPDDCRVGLVILKSGTVNAAIAPGAPSPCTFFTLAVTEGAVRRLPVAQLRAALAHELGHVHLGHFETRQERKRDIPVVLRPLTRGFDRREEAEADAFAADLLRSLESRYPGACLALVRLLGQLRPYGGELDRWLAQHPSPERRAEVARAACAR